MARPRLNTVNFVYTTIGIGVAAGVGYLVWRQLRNRGATKTEDSLMDFRRSTRKAGRAVKDTAQQIGKSVKRGAKDTTEAFEDASSSGQPLIEQDSTGYNRI